MLPIWSETVDIHCRGLRPAGMWYGLTGRLVLEVSRQRSRLIFMGRMSRAVTCIFRRQILKHKTCKIKKQRKCRGTVCTEPVVQYDMSTDPQHMIRLSDSFTSSDTFLTLANFTPNHCSNQIIALFYSLISKLHPLLNHANVYL